MEKINVEKILEKTRNAILSSGKSIDDIPKGTILKYLEVMGVPKSQLDLFYQALTRLMVTGFQTENTQPVVVSSKPQVATTEPLDNKAKQPRKSVFGEVKRIA